ncbi:thrombospondin type 3 repeat-containing protein [Mesoflavibacter profundi]|uniref:Thrombospondin type 3 repeat-containing protein n=3 Tax=Mesoflavibacter TaxID=444051 RepID=A0ABT4S2B3_9FLAO|nr:thrombospondin type 3 repeat-containing protein [Mesoflavibacter profundi]
MTNVKVLDLDLRDDNTVFAATYGRGIFSGQFTFDPNGDDDNDGVVNSIDNCPSVANADQLDSDNNGIGDACQDTDQDGILDINDNCPTVANPDQLDSDNNGVGDVCQDSDGDGVFDSVDNCVDTPNPNQEDINNNGIGDICDTSYAAQDNISVEVVSETCEGQDNGKININVNETYVTYTVTVNGPGTNISEQLTTNNLTIENLPVGGPYTVCVSVNEYDHVQCSEVSVEAAETIELELIEQNNGEDIEVNMYRGTAPYTVTLNGEVILITSQDNIILENLKSGLLEIKTAQACEGTFAKQINIIEFKATPNPVVDNLKVILPNGLDADALPVNVYDINGRVVYSDSFDVANNKEIYIPFQSLRSGVYFVNIQSEKAPKTIKIIKK